MNKKALLLAASIFALAPWAPLPASAESAPTGGPPPAAGHGGNPEAHPESPPRNRESYGDVVLRRRDALKLSTEQVAGIETIHRENQARIEAIARKLRETRRAAYETFLNPASDEAAVREAAREHTAAFGELVETALKSRAAINAVLTPDQANQLKSLKLESKPSHDQESTYP